MNLPDSDSEDELPPGWEERVTSDGSVFYANHLTKLTQWTHPRTGRKKRVSGELPFGWERCVDEKTGKIIYADHENRRTTYTDPRLAFAIEEKEHPNDFRQRFDASSTAFQVLHGRDLSGKTAIITGANAGIGFETARSLCLHGCRVIFACRNTEAAKEAIETIKKDKPHAASKCEVVKLDLASLKDVLSFVEEMKSRNSQIDMLILNAAVFGMSYSRTTDGYETTFQVCHLSHMFMTLLLEPLLVSGSRVVVVSSESHRFANLTTDTISQVTLSPESSSHYWDMMAYNNAKLCNVLFAQKLAHMWQHKGISVFSLHPGNMVFTNLSKSWWLYRLLFMVVRPFTKSLQQAAATTIYCAAAPELISATGIYFNNCCRCEISVSARNIELAESLWTLSVEMINSAMGQDCLPSYKDNVPKPTEIK